VRRLADQGLLYSEWRQAEGRERRYYQLSSLGAELLSQLTDEWQQLNGALAFLLEQSADTNGSDINSSDESAEEI
jgi:DNA-binding PadR family transcriptional regulator